MKLRTSILKSHFVLLESIAPLPPKCVFETGNGSLAFASSAALFAHWTQTKQASASVAQYMPSAEAALARFSRWQIAAATR